MQQDRFEIPSERLHREAHGHICSPLSVLTYPSQLAWKSKWLEETIGPIDEFVEAKEEWGYRKKVEFSFYADDDGLSLAFFQRGGKARPNVPGSVRYGRGMSKLPLGCALASEKMNDLALSIRRVLEEEKIPKRTLKSLIILESKSMDERIAALFVKDKPFPLTAEELSKRANAPNLLLIHSDYRSPASVITEILDTVGKNVLFEVVLDARLQYPFDGFFQNNVPVFEVALEHMGKWIEPRASLIDLYCGVGTIGIALGKNAKSVFGIEHSEGMVAYAKKNAEENAISNYHAIAGPAEKLIGKCISGEDIVVVDPPRSGLHQKVIARLDEVKPRRIIYLSCNAQTQARDIALLQGYGKQYAAGFDMYPGTLHMESLIVLDRI